MKREKGQGREHHHHRRVKKLHQRLIKLLLPVEEEFAYRRDLELVLVVQMRAGDESDSVCER